MPARKRIVFVLPALEAGGAERVLITLMNSIDRATFDPALVSVRDGGRLRELIDPSIPCFFLGGNRVATSLPSLLRCLRKLRPDLAMSTMAHMNFAVLMLRPLLPRTRMVVREAVTPSFIIHAHPLAKWLIKSAYRFLYPTADLVVSPAKVIIEEFQSLLSLSGRNHVVLPNPVNVALVRSSIVPPIPRRNPEEVLFVASGRLHPQKGFDRLIAAVSRMQMPGPWRLVILGEGGERARLEAMIGAEGLQSIIELAGHVGNPWRYYASADCFLLPSRDEGLPNVVLESLTCGTPVIATRESGGIAEIADRADAAVTIVDDMEAFVREMQKVVPRKERFPRLSLLPGHYEQQEVVARLEELLLDVAEGRSANTDSVVRE